MSTGRTANLAGLGVESVGLDPGARSLAVDGRDRFTGPDGSQNTS